MRETRKGVDGGGKKRRKQSGREENESSSGPCAGDIPEVELRRPGKSL